MSWQVALLWTFGLSILGLCAIVLWPRKVKPLRRPHHTVGRDYFHEYHK